MNLFKKIVLGVSIVGLSYLPLTPSAQAEEFNLLKSLVLPIEGYQESQKLPETFKTTAEVTQALGTSRNIALHMEIIRRAYHQLSMDEHEVFLKAIHSRQREIEGDTYRSFDEGYAQWMFRGNKTALYYLRKVNDKLKNQFTNLAYAMAQAEVDINDEMASPLVLTRRKQDVTYKLFDAVAQDAQAHSPGFWPSFVNVLDKLAELKAYSDFATSDFAQSYVPYGKQVMPSSGLKDEEPEELGDDAFEDELEDEEKSEGELETENADTETENTEAPACQLSTDTSKFNFANLYRSISIDFDGDGEDEALHFFYTDKDNWYQVAIINQNNEILADLHSPTAPYILEDLDQDDIPELVIRKFKHDRLHPVQVYRFNDCSFEVDPDVEAYFK